MLLSLLDFFQFHDSVESSMDPKVDTTLQMIAFVVCSVSKEERIVCTNLRGVTLLHTHHINT